MNVKPRRRFTYIVKFHGTQCDPVVRSIPNEYATIKFKEKTTNGSTRPFGGFEKATSKKKKKANPTVQLQT
jgi:hypothetical protein